MRAGHSGAEHRPPRARHRSQVGGPPEWAVGHGDRLGERGGTLEGGLGRRVRQAAAARELGGGGGRPTAAGGGWDRRARGHWRYLRGLQSCRHRRPQPAAPRRAGGDRHRVGRGRGALEGRHGRWRPQDVGAREPPARARGFLAGRRGRRRGAAAQAHEPGGRRHRPACATARRLGARRACPRHGHRVAAAPERAAGYAGRVGRGGEPLEGVDGRRQPQDVAASQSRGPARNEPRGRRDAPRRRHARARMPRAHLGHPDTVAVQRAVGDCDRIR
mmetsp:Transcript_118381/g.317505  ORF Transcript_118381/g.317505 Transcript_118381/m.317505 type:complete len:274 (+) Transcript_118381:1107-1928(+)